MSFWTDNSLVDDEYEAWRNVVSQLEKITPASVDLNSNVGPWADLFDAIRLWGERLVALRIEQDETTRKGALNMALEGQCATARQFQGPVSE